MCLLHDSTPETQVQGPWVPGSLLPPRLRTTVLREKTNPPTSNRRASIEAHLRPSGYWEAVLWRAKGPRNLPLSFFQSGWDPGQGPPGALGSALCTAQVLPWSSRSHLPLKARESTSTGRPRRRRWLSGFKSSRCSLVAPRGDMCQRSLLTEPKLEYPWEIMDFLHYFKRTLPWQLPVDWESCAVVCTCV